MIGTLSRHSSSVWSIAVLAIGIAISGALTWWTTLYNHSAINDHLGVQTRQTASQIAARLGSYGYGLNGVAAAVLASGEEGIHRPQFESFANVQSLTTDYPGVQGFGFIQRVEANQLQQFVEQVKADGYEAFSLKQDPANFEEHYVIRHIEPLTENQALLGVDLATDADSRRTLRDAMLRGTVRFVNSGQWLGGGQNGYLLLAKPIYPQGITPSEQVYRRQNALGWSFAVLDIHEALADVSIDSRYLRLRLTERSAQNDNLLYQSASLDKPVMASHFIEQEYFGRLWRLEMQALDNARSHLHLLSPIWVLGIGAVISILLAALIAKVVENHWQKMETESVRRRMVALVETTPDGVVTTDLQGRITDWNDGAEHLFGYNRDEVLGKTLSVLIVPEGLRHEEQSLMMQVRHQQQVSNFRSRRLRKDRITVYVSLSISAIISQGRHSGIALVFRNVGDEVVAHQQIEAMNRSLENLANARTRELENSKRFLRTLLDAIPPAVGYLDMYLKLTLVNTAFAKMFNRSEDRLVGMQISEVVHPAMVEQTMEKIQSALEGNRELIEKSCTNPQGEFVQLLTHLIPDMRDDVIKGVYIIVYDITEIVENRRKLVEVTRENEDLLYTIDEQMVYSKAKSDGSLVEVNDNYCRALGMSQEQLVGTAPPVFASEACRENVWPSIQNHIKMGKTWRGELCLRHTDGHCVWFQCVVVPATQHTGYLTTLGWDITEQKAIEQERDTLEQQFTSMLNAASSVAILATDNQGNITLFNRGAESLLGYEADEVLGSKNFVDFLEPEELKKITSNLQTSGDQKREEFAVVKTLASQKALGLQHIHYRKKDGSDFIGSLSLSPLGDSRSSHRGFIGLLIDITNEVNSHRALIEVRDQLTSASELAHLGIATMDLATRHMRVNGVMRDIYELPESAGENEIYDLIQTRIHPDDKPELKRNMEAALGGPGHYDLVFRVVFEEQIKYVSSSVYFHRNEQDELVSITGINRDITEQLRLEQQLREAKDIADQSNRAKSQFLANMSHEIRTPLNAVMGLIQLLRRTRLDASQKDYANKAEVAANSLLALLNDILDFSKIEAGKIEIDSHTFDLEDLLTDLAVVLTGTEKYPGVELLFDIAPNIPKSIKGDSLRLLQILVNLSSNALKFTETGYVLVRIKSSSNQQEKVNLCVEVIDSGIGISDEQQSKLFEGFVQAEASTSRRFGGTGLGLAICRRLVELMGGTLQLESQLGMGSGFWFELSLPVVDSTPAAGYPSNNGDLSALKVLLMHENTYVRNLLVQHLQSLNIEPWVVHSINEVAGQSLHFNVVMLDGRAAQNSDTTQIMTELKAKPIYLCDPGQEISQGRGGDDCILPLPYLSSQLYKILSQALSGERDIRPETEHTPGQDLSGLHILVVEDNTLNQQIARELLTQAGALVSIASDGKEGVEAVTESANSFDVVLMDMQMPDIDGLEATRQIRADERQAKLPIIALTANASSADKQRCLAVGMNGYITKPFNVEQVISIILEQVRGESMAHSNDSDQFRQNSGKSNGVNSENSNSANTQESLLDSYETIIARFGGNPKVLAKVQPKFLPDMMEHLENLKNERENNNTAEVKATLHTIKGVAGTVGAKGLSQFAANLEAQFKVDEPPLPQAVVSLSDIEQLLELIDQSNRELAALVPSAQTNSQQPKSIDGDKLKHDLKELRQLLLEDNLQALDEAEQLSDKLTAGQQQKLGVLIEHINSLAFSEALSTLDNILEEM